MEIGGVAKRSCAGRRKTAGAASSTGPSWRVEVAKTRSGWGAFGRSGEWKTRTSRLSSQAGASGTATAP